MRRCCREFERGFSQRQTQQQTIRGFPISQPFHDLSRSLLIEQKIAPGRQQIAVINSQRERIAIKLFRLFRLPAPRGNFAQTREQPQAIASILSVIQRTLQCTEPGGQLATVGTRETDAGAIKRGAVQCLQGVAFGFGRRVIRLHQKDCPAPCVRRGKLRIGLQCRSKIGQCAVEVVPVLL